MISNETKNVLKASAIVAASALSWVALDAAIDYDNDAHPSLGKVEAHSEPDYNCHWNGKFRSCGWDYWLYINGCVELPAEMIEQAKRQDADWEPEKGWVKVSGKTWSEVPDGPIIQFREKNFLNSIILFGFGDNNAESCNE
jgi:hypothetical protein